MGMREERVDVAIIGAGLSGIGAAHRLQTVLPELSYTILEMRDRLGGTWDLFRYPGVRADSDMYTLGYVFKPWTDDTTLPDGSAILGYVQELASERSIDKHIHYSSRVISADFDTSTARWTLIVGATESTPEHRVSAKFLYSCAGYYDYDNPYTPQFSGLETFEGQLLHPQFWPADADYAGKQVAVIGSGATAVTLVPAMLSGPGAAAHVTMVQRSPTWIGALPAKDAVGRRIRSILPEQAAYRVIRLKNLAFSIGFYEYCRRLPGSAAKFLQSRAAAQLGDRELVTQHFTPSYNPWDQRLCATPDADIFRVIRQGRADVVTGRLEGFVPEGLRLTSGDVVPADIVVTATGLRLLPLGGVALSVDGAPVDLSQQYVWRGGLMTGLPNFAFAMGYSNNSWTLRADLTHRLVCRVLRYLRRKHYDAVVPRPRGRLTPGPILNLTSGYVQRSIESFPHLGQRSPWRVRRNYVLDAISTLFGRLDRELVPVPATGATSPLPQRPALATWANRLPSPSFLERRQPHRLV